jgi:hypothetical protein
MLCTRHIVISDLRKKLPLRRLRMRNVEHLAHKIKDEIQSKFYTGSKGKESLVDMAFERIIILKLGLIGRN